MKKGSKPKSQSSDSSSSLVVDKDWVAEHARQVSRIIVGGIGVVGIYAWASEAAFKNSIMLLCQTVKGVAESASLLEDDLDERLLVHICCSPRRWACRNCKLSSNITSSSLRPCDFKMGRVLTSRQTFKCFYNFDLRLPIYQERALRSETLVGVLRNGILNYVKELQDAKAMIDGNMAVDDIKDDIIRSLLSRLDIICDEAGEDVGPNNDVIKETRNDSSSEKPDSQLVLHSFRKNCNL